MNFHFFIIFIEEDVYFLTAMLDYHRVEYFYFMPRPHCSFIICLLTTVFALPVNAATVTWTGATNSNWATGSNWGGTAPTSATSDIANIPNTATSPILSTTGATATDVRIGSTAAAASLTINGNGVLTDTNGYVGYQTGSTGTATVTGSAAQWISSTLLYIGNNGNGTLNVQNGATVSGTTIRLGNGSATTGTATVDGNGSLLSATSGNLFVGTSGNGVLNIQNGGKVVAGGALIAANVAGKTGDILVTGTGSQLSVTTNATIGSSGSGSLTIQSGGQASVTSILYAGSAATGSGTITVTGTGSQLNTSNNVRIGDQGTGSISVLNGAIVNANIGNATSSYLGIGNNGNNVPAGSLTVSGSGSVWSSYSFYAGYYGVATVLVNNGGSLVGRASGYLGYLAGGTASATVTGLGSSWNSAANFSVGDRGQGVLNITNGGTASALTNYVGRYTGASGTVLVSGNNSVWSSNTDLIIGGEGSGSVTLQDHAVANVSSGTDYIYKFNDGSTINKTSTSTIYLAVSSGSTGTLNIGADVLSAAAAAGTTNAERVQFGLGTGKIVFNHTDTAYDFAADLVGAGTLQFVTGTTRLTGDNTLFTGTVTGTGTMTVASGETDITTNSSSFAGTTAVTGGILRVNGSLGGTTTISGTGRLQGNSTLGSLVVNSSGTVAPGNSIGTVNTTNVTYNPGSTYEVEVNSAGQSDRIIASGTATLNGGTVEAILFPDFIANTPYTILTAAGGITGSFAGTSDDYLFLASTLTQDANNVYLTLNADTSAMQSAARSLNQRAVASSINDPALAANSAINALFLSASVTDLDNNLDRLSGEIHASLAGVLISDQRLLREAVLSDDFLEGTQALQGASGRIWFHSFGSWTNTDDTFNTASMDNHTTGFLTGVEKQGERYNAGIGFGASHTNLEQDALGSKAQSNNYHAIAYGNTKLTDKDKVTVGTSYTFHDIDTSRDVEVTTFSGSSDADYHAQTGQIFGEISHDFAPVVTDDKAKAELYLQGAYILQKGEDFTEDGTAGLSGDSQWDNIATSTLGVRLHREIETENEKYFTLLGGLAWQHAYGPEYQERDMRFNNTSSSFTVEGAPIDKDAVLLNAGVGLYVSPALSLNVSYDGGFSENTTQHGITGRANWKF